MFLKNKNIIFKIRRSKVTDYAALTFLNCNGSIKTSPPTPGQALFRQLRFLLPIPMKCSLKFKLYLHLRSDFKNGPQMFERIQIRTDSTWSGV